MSHELSGWEAHQRKIIESQAQKIKDLEALEAKAEERDLYAKALELACQNIRDDLFDEYGPVAEKWDAVKPQYWLDKARKEMSKK